MINPDAELNRLRWRLHDLGWSTLDVDAIITQAESDIDQIIVDIVSDSVAKATDYAIDLGAEEFIEDMQLEEFSGFYRITTITGRTDFSQPEKKMLPHLLQNAETNPETGIRSKVIPVGGKSSKKDIFSVMRSRQSEITAKREELILNAARSDRANMMAARFRDIVDSSLAARRQEKQSRLTSNTGQSEIEFRTASSTQDPENSWVIPAKEMDMTGFLMSLNAEMQEALNYAVPRLINIYIENYS